MSFKQDRTGARTPADLERKYMFGKSFAEVYALAEDAKTAADKASEAVDALDSSLSHEEIFNRLTNYGAWQGVYRDGENIYMNASYIMSGTLAAERIDADNLKVKAANITDKLTASQIDAKDLSVSAANITGSLTAGSVETFMANVTGEFIAGKITAGILDAKILEVDAAKITGVLSADHIDAENLSVSAANVYGTLYSVNVAVSGALAVIGGGSIGSVVSSNQYGATYGVGVMDSTGLGAVVATDGGAKLASDHSEVIAAYNITLKTKNAIEASTNITVTSDRRAKEDIQYNVDDYLKVFDDLMPCTFVWRDSNDKRRQFGMIAQDVEENLGNNSVELHDFAPLRIRDDGTYGLVYEGFIPLLIAKVQQLDAEVKELKQNG